METLKEKWHNFKIWFCKEEVDFWQKEGQRLSDKAKEWEEEAFRQRKQFDALNQLDAKIIEGFKKERADLLFLDHEKIVTTDVVTADEFGRPVQKKVLMIAGRVLSPEETRILKEEATYIKRTMWWDLVQNTVVNTAKLKMFEGSKDYADMVGGKGILYAADIYRKILDRILE